MLLPALSASVLVFAAASLTDALQEIGDVWEKETGIRIVANLGASSMLARQIEEGAPADLFLSADEAQMDRLFKAGLIVRGTRTRVVSNALVVVVPRENTREISSEIELAGPAFERIALAEPRSVPVGVYAKKFLESAGIWRALEARIVPTENARATLAAVEAGNADAGIVYRTDALVSKRVRVAFEVPASRAPFISYPFALVKGAPHEAAARRFLEYLSSKEARAVFARHGFNFILALDM
jgi:molybdate transport system substrate-binding protein